MSEENTTPETPAAPQAEPVLNTPQIPDTVISEAVNKALTDPKIKEQLMSQVGGTKGYSKGEVESLLAADRERVANAILGKTNNEKRPDPILETLVQDPARFVSVIKEITLNEARQEQAAAREQAEEIEAAYNEVLAKRPDVTGKEAFRRLYTSIYEKTDEAKPEKERMREALAKFDAELEDAGIKPDIKEEVGIGSGNVGSMSYLKSSKDLETSWKEAQQQRVSEWEKAMNIDS